MPKVQTETVNGSTRTIIIVSRKWLHHQMFVSAFQWVAQHFRKPSIAWHSCWHVSVAISGFLLNYFRCQLFTFELYLSLAVSLHYDYCTFVYSHFATIMQMKSKLFAISWKCNFSARHETSRNVGPVTALCPYGAQRHRLLSFTFPNVRNENALSIHFACFFLCFFLGEAEIAAWRMSLCKWHYIMRLIKRVRFCGDGY